VSRRLVNIIWTMLTYGEHYVNPPMIKEADFFADKALDPAPEKTAENGGKSLT
jgi:hypothetical protein